MISRKFKDISEYPELFLWKNDCEYKSFKSSTKIVLNFTHLLLIKENIENINNEIKIILNNKNINENIKIEIIKYDTLSKKIVECTCRAIFYDFIIFSKSLTFTPGNVQEYKGIIHQFFNGIKIGLIVLPTKNINSIEFT